MFATSAPPIRSLAWRIPAPGDFSSVATAIPLGKGEPLELDHLLAQRDDDRDAEERAADRRQDRRQRFDRDRLGILRREQEKRRQREDDASGGVVHAGRDGLVDVVLDDAALLQDPAQDRESEDRGDG